ncbi:Crp/Fnr family transcriptional regulator [Mucilaginibacter sp. KACC 22063]|uniref:Crp/Fnr family transcriptional regulator n=1 Tax=Mucilaginibacter sp. KACC 22063 TaxID=3025666 RepID=UPI002365E6F4|nr:Crp/Fnr family transcriptional regulator [Mucilaginibacter sp. KACC 22063]WDF55735.1 Crp/Fnr family transcriptional regulator [Mucilaginibacter sp. KACC 22063]
MAFPEFENYLKSLTDLSDAEVARISALAKERKLRKNEFLLREGEICRHKTFVLKGMLRNFGTAPDGSEHILQFSPELTWTLDAESYDNLSPARYSICAVEPTEVLQWTKNDFNTLLIESPKLKSLSEKIISRNIYNSRQRLLTALSATPEEKYEDFIKQHPGMLSRLPLKMIAAYLGISLKTLTRIRHAQLLATK